MHGAAHLHILQETAGVINDHTHYCKDCNTAAMLVAHLSCAWLMHRMPAERVRLCIQTSQRSSDLETKLTQDIPRSKLKF